MEIESSSSVVVAKKVWNIVRVLLRKGIAKTKIVADLNLLLKRGKLAGKALMNTVMFNQHQFTCRSHDTFISPHEYEFSCSNSPAVPKRKHHRFFSKSSQYDDVSTFNAVQKVLQMLNNNDNTNSPLHVPLPGFGNSPIGIRQLRVTDSPFPVNYDGDSRVDMAAEEFIKKFYKDLNSQKKMAPNESPYNIWWQR